MKISKDYLKQKRDPHLHSPAHVLADELSSKLGDPKHFAFYLKAALTYDHSVLRRIAGTILEGTSKHPGALFAYLLKKHNQERDVSSGISIWLLPAHIAYDLYDRMIKNLASSGPAPSFEPHVTLLNAGDMSMEEASEMFQRLADGMSQFEIETELIATGDEYFKSMYVPIVKDKAIQKYRRMARKIFKQDKPEKFAPHLSVLYGIVDPKEKLTLIRNITTPLPKKFLVDRIALVNTMGRANEWQKIQEVTLKDEPKDS